MNKIKIIRTLLFATVAFTAASTPGFAAEFYLRADVATKTMPDGEVIPMWGFAQDTAFEAGDGTVFVPGPTLTVPAGDSNLTIHLDNNLSVPISLVINGQIATMTPVKFTDSESRQRIRSFTHETAPGNAAAVDYVWTNLKPGSYVYHSGTHPAVQVQMGLYGAVIKDLPDIEYDGTSYKQAYPNVVYEDSVTLFYSEIDPALHNSVNTGTYGPGLAMTSTIDYEPKYFLVNGQSFDPASPGSSVLPAGSSGGGTLLRIFNMGLRTRCPLLLGSYMTLIAEDGQPSKYPKEQYVAFVPAFKTIDATVAFPAAGTFPIFDRRLGLTNAAATNGGMRANLAVTAGDAWPVITSVTATPASIPDTGTSQLQVNATDSDTPSLTYAWTVPAGAGSLDDPASASPTFTPDFIAGAQTYTLTVTVSDGSHIDIGTVDVTVTGNLAPVIESVTAIPNVMLNGGTSQLLVTATDTDGPAPLSYNWTAPDGIFSDSTIENPIYTPPVVVGTQTFTLTVEVSDGAGAVSTGTVDVIVAESNISPVINSVTATDPTIGDNQTSNLEVGASDADDGPLPLSYNWIMPAGAGSVSDPTSATPVYTPPNVTVETTFTLTVNVSDGLDTVSGTVNVTVTPTNDSPVITSVTATPNPVLDAKTSQLQVVATDPDGDPLGYNWIVPAGAGSVSNTTIANPVYTPPDVTADQTYILTVEVSDGLNTVSDTVSITVSDAFIFSATFDTGTDGFTYSDGAFNDTANPAYEDGFWNSAEGALQVTLGDVDNTLVPGMSGGWQGSFDLGTTGGNVSLSFRYNLTQSRHYELGENSEVLVDVDGERVLNGGDDFIAKITGNGNGGPSITTGWQIFTVTLPDPLAAGAHTITIGGYNNLKDKNNEYTTVLIDDVLLLRD